MTREESIEFYKAYSRKLFNVSFRIVGDSALAEEIMQDTVLKFFRFVEEGEMADRGGGDSSLALRMTKEALRMTKEPLGMTKEPLRMTDVAGRKAIEAWLVRTCVRGSIDALRRLKREREFLGEYETWQGSAAEVGQESSSGESGRITVEDVKKAMGALPSPYRLILTLVLIDGLDYEEISEITGEKEGALRTRFSRARKMLAERLREGR
ncbi:MAG: RNA polymerase sigma factor [Bacteroidales bacterium]|nr:RNA polymerase sigma factor [Bacteroidales bacterium]